MEGTNPYESPTFGNSLLLRVDGAVGAMSLSPNGRDAVMAGRRGLFIIDLDDPFTTPRWLHHITSWEVADVQWSPHHSVKPSWCISTSNQKALLWDLSRPSNNAIQNILHQHTRAIADINFHPLDPEVLATCSIDTFVLGWDMRTPRKAVIKLAEWRAGATQVKWNHENPYQLASSHDHNFYIWDSRKGALPVAKVEKAHRGKINGIDFSGGLSNIVTCSNDKKVKLWDLKSLLVSSEGQDSFEPSVIINTDFPVARARMLPFGREKSCGIMPLRDGDDSIHIVNLDAEYREATELGKPLEADCNSVYSFKGHNGAIKDFLWRTRHENYGGFEGKNQWKDYQLVTWSSQDFDLKLWPFDEDLYAKVSYNPTHETLLDSFTDVDQDSAISRSKSPELWDFDRKITYDYQTYCVEPPVTLNDLEKDSHGDQLSSLVLYRLYESHKQERRSTNQLDHLDWISGVRMGRSNITGKDNVLEDTEGPLNLGEELSIVGHKFPKIRFEKISVSTGELVLSLRGPVNDVASLKLIKSSSETDDNKSQENGKGRNISESIPHEALPPTENDTDRDHVTTTGPNTSDLNPTEEALQSSLVINESQEPKLVFIRMEVNFPKNYPFNVAPPSKNLKDSQRITFHIEETHELTTPIKNEMLKNLNEMATFYTVQHHMFCLEPCLRYLMGEKIDMSQSLILESVQNNTGDNSEDPSSDILGSDADDLVRMKDDSSAEEDADGDLMPLAKAMEGLSPVVSGENDENAISIHDQIEEPKLESSIPNVDSTPLPKGCGAIWSPSGKLVCFFFPKNEDDNREINEFNKIKFAEGGFSLKKHTSNGRRTTKNRPQSNNSGSINSDSNDSDSEGDSNSSDDDNDLEVDSLKEDNSSDVSSDESFVNDLDEIYQEDLNIRARVPDLFKASLGLGKGQSQTFARKKSSKFTSHTSVSNPRSSIPGDTSHGLKRRKNRNSSRHTNVVGIFDFSHLLPVKYELACEYRVLGDSPELLAAHNYNVALKYGYQDLCEVWKILEMILTREINNAQLGDTYSQFPEPNFFLESMGTEDANSCRFTWGTHPFGQKWLIKEIFDYFERKGDVQMLAMMSCILYENSKYVFDDTSEAFNVPIHTPYQVLPLPPSNVVANQYNDVYEQDSSLSREGAIGDPRSLENDPVPGFNIKRESPFSNAYANSVISSHEGNSTRALSPDLHNSKHFSNDHFLPISDSLVEKDPSYLSQRTRHSLLKSRAYDLDSKTKLNSKIKNKGSQQPVVSIDIMNADELDLYDYSRSSTLLDAQDSATIKSYREMYADILFLWGLPINRIKILKFNYPDANNSEPGDPFIAYKASFGFRKKGKTPANQQTVTATTNIESAQSNSWNSSKRKVHKYCNLCDLIVSGNFTVCTNCEHILHSSCAFEWWGSFEGEHQYCPSGCGCKCLEQML